MTIPSVGRSVARRGGRFRATVDVVAYASKTLRLVWRSSPTQTFALGVTTVAGGLAPLGVAIAAKSIVDAIVARNSAGALRWVLVELACVAVLSAGERGVGLLRTVLGARLGLDINNRVLDKALRLDLPFFEDSAFRDQLLRAQGEAAIRPIALVLEAFGLLQGAITLTGYAILAARFSPWAVVALCAATLPATLSEIRFSRLTFGVHNDRSPDARRLLYLEHLLSDDRHVKEVKLFDVGRTLFARYGELGERLYDEERHIQIRRASWTHAWSLLATAAVYASYAVMVVMAVRGALALGDVTLYVLALRQGQQAFQSVLGTIGRIYEHSLYMSNLWAFLDMPSRARCSLRGGAAPPGVMGIVIDGVGFRYPGKDTWALRGVSMRIPPGESVALVGGNGAGKTTLVKLMTRLYEPTEGRILLDGRDVREWDERALRRRFGVVFQDFNRYQLSVRENVAIGRDGDDDAKISSAIARAGAEDVVRGLPRGLDAQLGNFFAEGAELSGGQWQKLALARAFMRDDADILVLDEPTAALDAHAEHAVFERFRRLALGRTTIVISHRFPTVRMANQIFVLADGGVREQGTHDELVAVGGAYAQMFALQAEGYR